MRYRFIGDTLLTVPFLRNLRAAYPDAVIDLLAAPRSGEILRDCPYIDELLMFDTSRKHRYENPDSPMAARSFRSYVGWLRSRKYDTAFVLKRSFSAAMLAFLAGIPQRIGFDTEGRGLLLTRRVSYRPDAPESECFLDVLRAVDIPVRDAHLEGWWRPEEAEKAQALLTATESDASHCEPRHMVLHLTSSNPARQWPEAHAVRLAEWLLSHPDLHLHALGAASDAETYESLRGKLSPENAARLHIHCGKLALTESMAFLQRMTLVVGVDSGVLHMASAAGTPVIALFGPMDERKWGAAHTRVVVQPMACRPCNLKIACPFDLKCMKDLQPEAVIETIRTYAGLS